MNELNRNLRAQQIELSLELQEFLGPVNRVDDICYSQPDTFWYCSRLMKQVKQIIDENQEAKIDSQPD